MDLYLLFPNRRKARQSKAEQIEEFPKVDEDREPDKFILYPFYRLKCNLLLAFADTQPTKMQHVKHIWCMFWLTTKKCYILVSTSCALTMADAAKCCYLNGSYFKEVTNCGEFPLTDRTWLNGNLKAVWSKEMINQLLAVLPADNIIGPALSSITYSRDVGQRHQCSYVLLRAFLDFWLGAIVQVNVLNRGSNASTLLQNNKA